MTYRDEDRWIIKPCTKGKATYLARLRFPEDNAGAVWRTLCDNEGGLPGFAWHQGDSGIMEVNPEVQTANMKRKRRRMQHKSTFRVYTLDPNEAVIAARHTHTRILYWIRTHEIV